MNRFSSRPIVAALLALPLLTAAGCTGGLNSTDSLLGTPELPALTDAQVGDRPSTDQPSLANGLDRRAWTTTTVVVPRGQVEHQPTYWTQALPDRSLPRQRGEWPTGGEVLDGAGDPGIQAIEAGANLVWTPAQILIAPVEMIAEDHWPWTTLRSGPDYSRTPPPMTRDPWRWVTPHSATTPTSPAVAGP